jgi:hypothetical protein
MRRRKKREKFENITKALPIASGIFSLKRGVGLSPVSFWPTRASLLQMLADNGFGKTTVIDDDPVHEHGPGPAITLVARQG